MMNTKQWTCILFEKDEGEFYRLMSDDSMENAFRWWNEEGPLAWLQAIQENRHDVMDTLIRVIQYGAPWGNGSWEKRKENWLDEGLIMACNEGHVDMVRRLLSQEMEDLWRRASQGLVGKADIHAKEDHALHRACEKGHVEVINYLLTSQELEEKADITASKHYAFLTACFNQQWKVVDYLLSQWSLAMHQEEWQKWKIIQLKKEQTVQGVDSLLGFQSQVVSATNWVQWKDYEALMIRWTSIKDKQEQKQWKEWGAMHWKNMSQSMRQEIREELNDEKSLIRSLIKGSWVEQWWMKFLAWEDQVTLQKAIDGGSLSADDKNQINQNHQEDEFNTKKEIKINARKIGRL